MYTVYWRSLLGDCGGEFTTNSMTECIDFVHGLDRERDILITVFHGNNCLRRDLF